MLHLTSLEFIFINTSELDTNEITDLVNWAELFSCSTDVTGVQAIGHGASSFVRALTIPKSTNTRRGGRRKRHGDIDNASMQVTLPAMSTASAANVAISRN